MLLASSRFRGTPDLAENVANGAVARPSAFLIASDEALKSRSEDDLGVCYSLRRGVIFCPLSPIGAVS
jgi:hypothetical protein